MPAAALWICCWAYFNLAGWLLSAAHQLNTTGYVAALLPFVIFVAVRIRKWAPGISMQKIFRRFRRPFPAVFLFLAILIFIGGLLYAPTNYDALTYRLPRMLNWLADGKWFWIPTINERMNYSGTAWEWVAMPLLALMHSDRALFLIDFSGFLLMPGLLFSIFRHLGITRRVAWTWMWILPLAFGYATQAGSIGNDLAGTVLCLASIFFGLRARRFGRIEDVWLALLAAALMTGVKMSDAPLALPCVVAVWPTLEQLRRRLFSSVFVAAAAVVISAAPIMALNQVHAGSWTGDPNDQYKMQVKNPVAALLGNSVLLAEQTFMPPVLPSAHKVKELVEHKLPASWSELLKRDYPRFSMVTLNEVPIEEGAGIGMGVSLLLVAGVLLSFVRTKVDGNVHSKAPFVVVAVWIAGLVYMLKMGSEAAPRLMLPYYPLMLAPLLVLPGQKWLVRCRAGRALMLLAALSILPALVLSPARPLWPGQTVCEKLAERHPNSSMLQRMASVYSTYAHRNDLLAPIRSKLPDDAREVGFIAGSNDSDYSLWRPFGRRKVVYPGSEIHQFLADPCTVQWLVVKEREWPADTTPLSAWAQANQFQIVSTADIVELVSWGGERWVLLHKEK